MDLIESFDYLVLDRAQWQEHRCWSSRLKTVMTVMQPPCQGVQAHNAKSVHQSTRRRTSHGYCSFPACAPTDWRSRSYYCQGENCGHFPQTASQCPRRCWMALQHSLERRARLDVTSLPHSVWSCDCRNVRECVEHRAWQGVGV
jgi:hypothetical protein